MKSSVIREMSLTELKERIENEKTMLIKLRMNHLVSSLENPLKLKYARKTIARLSTELTKREKNNSAVDNPNSTKGVIEEKKEPIEAKS